MTATYDLAVIGAGPAGAAAALEGAKSGLSVVLFERGVYPRHKVCGEFVSHESLELLGTLLGRRNQLIASAPRIQESRLFLDNGCYALPLCPAAASITRHALDEALWDTALESGVACCNATTVEAVEKTGETFTLRTTNGSVHTRAVINATGRWSRLPRAALQKTFSAQREKWMGLKAHFEQANAPQSVDLYFFDGGYCGVQPLAGNRVNACAMVRSDVAVNLTQVFALHPDLARRTANWRLVSDPVSTAPLIFAPISPVENQVLFAGDAAGFVDPFVGDGISLALHSGAMAAQCLAPFLSGTQSLAASLDTYRARYERQLLPIHRAAARFRRLLSLPRFARAPILHALKIPALGRWAIASTRGTGYSGLIRRGGLSAELVRKESDAK